MGWLPLTLGAAFPGRRSEAPDQVQIAAKKKLQAVVSFCLLQNLPPDHALSKPRSRPVKAGTAKRGNVMQSLKYDLDSELNLPFRDGGPHQRTCDPAVAQSGRERSS